MNYTPVPVRDLSDTSPEKLAAELTVEELAEIDAQLRADKAELDKHSRRFSMKSSKVKSVRTSGPPASRLVTMTWW